MNPARSRSEARALLAVAEALLVDRSRPVSADVVPASLRASGDESAYRFIEYDVDATMGGYVQALADQADPGSGLGAGRAKGAKRAALKKNRNRKKRRGR